MSKTLETTLMAKYNIRQMNQAKFIQEQTLQINDNIEAKIERIIFKLY